MADRITQQNKTYIEDGSTSKKIGIDAPAGVPADWTFTLPATDGTAGQILKTDGNGNTDWIDAAYDPAGSAASVQSNLDTHTGNTSNPHSTTKSQVGLSNVTNDEQLKRAAGDINSFTEKTSPIYDDLLLVEDSESSFAKKKIKVGSIAGSGINYIKATDGSSIGAWATYADAAGTSPVDGTGGSPSVTFAVSTDLSMRGASNFLFAHDNVNRQGEGFSYLCSIDPSDRGKVIRFNFEYLVASGTYADGDLTVWFYDVTNGQVIQGTPTSILNSSLIERFQSEVQVPITCAQMRVLVHVTTSTATAYTMRFENFSFGPSEKVYGQQITDPVDTGVTVWGASTTAPTKGVTSQDSVIMWREGKMACGIVQYKQSAATGGSAGSGYYKLNIASNLSKIGASAIDLSLIPASALSILATSPIDGTSTVGSFSSNYSSTTVMKGNVVVNSSTELAFHHIRSDTTGGVAPGAVTSSTPFFNSGSGSFSCYFKVPIVGWSSSSQVVSDDYTGREIFAAYGLHTSTQNPSTTVPVNFSVPLKDTTGSVTVSASAWKYTAPSNGEYIINVQIPSGGTTVTFFLYKNGVKQTANPIFTGAFTLNNGQMNGSTSVILNAGDYIDIRPDAAVTGLSANLGQISIYKLQGPSQVLASETVSASYYLSGNFTSSTTIPINFDTKEFDTHNAVTLRNIGLGIEWKFTAPVSGIYEIGGHLNTSAATLYFIVYKGGSAFKPVGVGYLSTQSAAYPSVKVELLAGQYIDIRANSGGSTVVGGAQSGNTTSYITITKV